MQRSIVLTCLALLLTSTAISAAEKKLKIVFMMGQSNMVGYFHPRTAWYLTQPVYVPGPKTATVKGKYNNWDEFYWAGVCFASGSKEYNAKGAALIAERTASRQLWRSRFYTNFSQAAREAGKKDEWNYKEWGNPPKGGRELGDFLAP